MRSILLGERHGGRETKPERRCCPGRRGYVAGGARANLTGDLASAWLVAQPALRAVGVLIG